MLLDATDRLAETDRERTDDTYDGWLVRGMVQGAHDLGGGSVRTGWSGGPDSRLAQSTIPLGMDAAGLFDEEEDASTCEDRFDARGRVVAEGSAGPVLLEGGGEAAVGTAELWLGRVVGAPDDVTRTRSAGTWSEVGLRLGPVVPVVGGRVDTASIGTWSAVTAVPRARIEVSAPARLRFVGTVSTAHQSPDDREVATGGGAGRLEVERALHGSLTAEQAVWMASGRACHGESPELCSPRGSGQRADLETTVTRVFLDHIDMTKVIELD